MGLTKTTNESDQPSVHGYQKVMNFTTSGTDQGSQLQYKGSVHDYTWN